MATEKIPARYCIHLVRGVGVGAGIYQVHDRQDGCDVGRPHYFADDAETVMRRLNREHRDAARAILPAEGAYTQAELDAADKRADERHARLNIVDATTGDGEGK